MSEKRDTLPQGWEWKKLPDVVLFGCQRGFNPPLIDGKVPFIGMSDIDEKHGRNTQYILESFEKVSNGKTKFQKNAVLVGKITPCTQNNKVSIVPDNIEGGFATTEVFALHCLDKMLPLFLNYFVRSDAINKLLVDSMMGATGRQRVPTEALKNLDIPLPPLEEQRRVVGKLDGLFAKIDKSIALLDESIASASALMPSALNEVFNANSIGEWKKYQFDKISKFIDYRGKTPVKTEEGIVLITAKNVRFGYLSDDPREYIASGDYEEWMTRGIPKIGDILFTTEAPLGNVALLDTDEKRAFAQRIVTFQAIGNEYNSNFLFWYLLSPYFQNELNKSATGTTVMGIKTAVLKKFEIPLPPLDIQTQTVAYLDALHVKAEALKKAQVSKKEELLALKASLLESAFKGEL